MGLQLRESNVPALILNFPKNRFDFLCDSARYLSLVSSNSVRSNDFAGQQLKRALECGGRDEVHINWYQDQGFGALCQILHENYGYEGDKQRKNTGRQRFCGA